jgi:hypothetical protein
MEVSAQVVVPLNRLIELLDKETELADKKARIEDLEREVYVLRLYGNKDCTAMADDLLDKRVKEE